MAEVDEQYFDNSKRYLALLNLATVARESGKEDEANRWVWESQAFARCAVKPLSRKEVGTYFGPLRKTDGGPFDENALDHLAERAKSTKNPMVRARFADILWETQREYKFARMAANAYLECTRIYEVEKRFIELAEVLQRAAELALRLGDTALAKKVEEQCVELLAWIKSLDEYRWGIEIVEALIEMKRTADKIALVQAYEFCKGAYVSLKRQNANNFSIQHAFIKLLISLAKVLNRNQEREEWRIEDALVFLREAEWKGAKYPNGQLVAAHFYEEAARVFQNLGMTAESRNALKLAQENMEEGLAKIKPTAVATTIHSGMLDQLVQGKTSLDLLFLLSNSLELVPDHSLAENIAKSVSEVAAITPRTLYEKSRRIAISVTPDEIRSALTARQYARSCQLNASLRLIPIFERFSKSGGSVKTFLQFLTQAGKIQTERLNLIIRGVYQFLKGDFISAIHVLVPQLEALLRSLADELGEPTTYFKDQTVQVHTLGTLISQVSIRTLMGEQLWHYCNALLVDELSFGLRDRVAHGLASESDFDQTKAAMLVHLLLLILPLKSRVPPTKD